MIPIKGSVSISTILDAAMAIPTEANGLAKTSATRNAYQKPFILVPAGIPIHNHP